MTEYDRAALRLLRTERVARARWIHYAQWGGARTAARYEREADRRDRARVRFLRALEGRVRETGVG